MNKLNEYNSIINASKELNICKNIVSNSCRGKTKRISKCGFIFKYAINN